MTDVSRCRSCGEYIGWVKTQAANNILAVEIARPIKRYVRVTLTRATANAAVDGIVAVQSNPAEAPVTQDASVLATDFALSPA